ncbi:MAG: hydroxymethylglutaryl-CoA lyase [Bacteroidota bacterium]
MKLIVTPRDAMQGIKEFIPTQVKSDYINCLLEVGFDVIDFGSFVSPKAIPQLQDTSEVVKLLDLSSSKSKLLAIVGNTKGATIGAQFDEINYFGYPFSTSPEFLRRNINATIEEAYRTIEEIQNICVKANKELVIFFSMAFGNSYGDKHNYDLVDEAIEKLISFGIKTINLADTIGIAENDAITNLFKYVTAKYPILEFGIHLHTKKSETFEKIESAIKGGCNSFDTALLGLGGCPMSGEEMIGNLSTELFVEYLEKNHLEFTLDLNKLEAAVVKSKEVFSFINL